MLFFLGISIIICTGIVVQCRELYRMVKLQLPNKRSQSYLVLNNVARLIPDDQTIADLNIRTDDIIPVNSEDSFSQMYTIGKPLPPIKYVDKSADDSVRIYILRSNEFNGDLLTNWTAIGDYINPSIILFRGRLLMIMSLQMGLSGSKRKIPTSHIEFRWVNNSNYPFYSSEPYLGIENEINELNLIIDGHDPRALVYNDTYFEIFYSYVKHGYHAQKMGFAVIRYLENEKRISITKERRIIWPREPLDSSINQKNWSPFLYNNDTYMIQSIHPLTVVRAEDYGSVEGQSILVSSVDYEFEYYLEGDLRGGTNGIRLSDRYLSFYHSRTRLPWNGMYTYVFGAYTFSLEPPFKVLSLSPTPIMPEQLYTGSWEGRWIDYCVYPMYIFMKDAETIHMSFGYQDKVGMTGEINLQKLLKTLVPMNNQSYKVIYPTSK